MTTEISERGKSIEEELRQDKTVTGLWQRLPSKNGPQLYQITYQSENGSARQITLYPGGNKDSISGEIIFKRLDKGNPARVTVFRSLAGEETILDIREF